MLSRTCGRIGANATGFTQRWDSFSQIRKFLSGVVKSAIRRIRETTYLEQIVHHADEVRLAIHVVSCNALLLRLLIVGTAMRKRQCMTKFMHERAGLYL